MFKASVEEFAESRRSFGQIQLLALILDYGHCGGVEKRALVSKKGVQIVFLTLTVANGGCSVGSRFTR